MKAQISTFLAVAGLCFAAVTVSAQDGPPPGGGFQQGGGGFQQGRPDPKRMHQMLMDRLRQQMEIKDDAEWKAISNRVTAVVQARMALGGGGGGPMMMGPPPGGGGFNGQPGQGGPPGGFTPPEGGGGPGGPGGGPEGFNGPGGGGPGGPGGFSRQNDPELDALRKAVEGKASNSELKTKLADLREARKKKQEALEKAQEDLRGVVTVRQEAILATMGLL
jgi:hypothetical protein